MAKSSAGERCPFCKRAVPADAERCPSCGEALFEEEEERISAERDRRPKRPPRRADRYEDDEDDDRIERRIRRRETVEATDFLIPTNVSGWSLAACYCGLIGFCLPLLGLPFAVTGLVCGIVALRRRKKAATYGAVTSDIRAILGLVLGGLGVLAWGGLAIFLGIRAAMGTL